MDIFDYYLSEEPDHVPALIEFLENKQNLSAGELFSNLFNFKANFAVNDVVVEDVCGLFCEKAQDRELVSTPAELLVRLMNASLI